MPYTVKSVSVSFCLFPFLSHSPTMPFSSSFSLSLSHSLTHSVHFCFVSPFPSLFPFPFHSLHHHPLLSPLLFLPLYCRLLPFYITPPPPLSASVSLPLSFSFPLVEMSHGNTTHRELDVLNNEIRRLEEEQNTHIGNVRTH